MDLQDNNGLSYEDARKQRLEENKKRMQELGLVDLSKSLGDGVPATKTSAQTRRVKPRLPNEFVELRRSSRVASNPAPDYREVDADSSLGRRSYTSSRASSLLMRKYASDEARLAATLQAETIMKELPRSTPSFVKPMLQSHTTGGFWLGLPSHFCKTHLPHKDDKVVLENEKGEEWECVYLANKTGLSGGWRGFSLDHGLVDGDALVFELVEPCRFKIHIVRAESDKHDEEESPKQTEMETEACTTLDKSKGKKKQVPKKLKYQKVKAKKKNVKESESESESEPETESDEDVIPNREIRRKEKKLAKEEETQSDEGVIPNREIRRKRKILAKEDDTDELFEFERDEGMEPETTNQITSFLRAEKPHFARGAKKPVDSCGEGISVC